MKEYLDTDAVERAYAIAKGQYAKLGVDADAAMAAVGAIPVSLHCWQGDDVTGFEGADGLTGGGILATGNYPGRARDAGELRADAELAFSLVPGVKRFSLHTMYAETGSKPVPRDDLEPKHFSAWMAWAKERGVSLDFNPSFFSHPLADSGYTLASADKKVRDFWLRHGKASRRIASAIGAAQGNPCVNNVWIPDGSKDLPADRAGPRRRLVEALDELFSEKLPAGTISDAVESKLFGIGSEAYVVGSHEFYMGYAVSRGMKLCMDMGHFHPTETIADKISAMLGFVPGLLLHVSRGLRWDSDHVALYSDDLRDLCRELSRQNAFGRVDIALDYFDASINRIAAWVIGARALQKALLEAALEPIALIREAENAGRNHERLALMEEAKSLPLSALWDKYCLDQGVPVGADWLARVARWESETLPKRR
ncbi:MAG TPA: L-rhamnose isomerase [Spirochaetaceae bacterium]|jgi:L-rhamnose isomerase|nr:L-rhamnose isomerase [Spirochaetaceae bacterium]